MFNLVSFNTIAPVKKAQNTQSNQNLLRGFYTQKADTFERSNSEKTTSCPISFTGKSGRLKEYKKVTDSLKLTAENAQTSLNGQLASDGWAGKVADSVSALWNSKNRAKLVQADIDSYKEQVNDLESSIKEDKFTGKFKEMFDVEYNHANIARYNKKAEQYKSAVSSEYMAKITEKKLSKDLERYNKLSGDLNDITERKVATNVSAGFTTSYNKTTSKDEIFSDMENSLVGMFGDKKVLDSILKSGGLDAEKATKEEKYKAYGFVANFLVETAKESAKKVSKGQSLQELREDYRTAYEKAYGNKNDIQKRVDDYNHSQEIGAAAVRGVTRSALMTAATLISPQATLAKLAFKSAMTLGIKVAVDGSDKLTNGIDNSEDMNADAVKKLVKSASISAAESFVSGVVTPMLPTIKTGNDLVDFGLEQAEIAVVDTGIGLVSEKLKKGVWAKNQIIPRMIISATFRNLKPDNEMAKDLLSMTKGGVNQAMKYSTRGFNPVKSFIEGTKKVLEDNYNQDNKTFADLKKLADEHPEKYEKLMAEMLQVVVDEQNEEGNKKGNKKWLPM